MLIKFEFGQLILILSRVGWGAWTVIRCKGMDCIKERGRYSHSLYQKSTPRLRPRSLHMFPLVQRKLSIQLFLVENRMWSEHHSRQAGRAPSDSWCRGTPSLEEVRCVELYRSLSRLYKQ